MPEEDSGKPGGEKERRRGQRPKRGERLQRRRRERRERSLREPEPRRTRATGSPGPARLYALVAAVLLSLLGIAGFFFDGGFGTGSELDGDDVAGVLIVNGWRNLIYLVSGLVALALAPARPRTVALGLGVLYLALGIAGAANTANDIGSLFSALPLTNEDNVFHIAVGAIGILAALGEAPLPRPSLPARRARGKRPRRRPADA